ETSTPSALVPSAISRRASWPASTESVPLIGARPAFASTANVNSATRASTTPAGGAPGATRAHPRANAVVAVGVTSTIANASPPSGTSRARAAPSSANAVVAVALASSGSSIVTGAVPAPASDVENAGSGVGTRSHL